MSVLSRERRRRSGFTLIEIMVVILIVSLLLMIAIPSFLGARERSWARTCIGQLRQIRYAKEVWAMDNRKESNEEPSWDDLYPVYLKSRSDCPGRGDYTINPIKDDPICSVGGLHTLE